MSHRCRRGASVRVEGHAPIPVETSSVSDKGFGILHLSTPLPESVLPLRLPAQPPEPCDRTFSFGQAYAEDLLDRAHPNPAYPYEIRGGFQEALPGAPLLDPRGELIAILLGYDPSGDRVEVEEIASFLDDPGREPIPTHSDVTWSYQVDLVSLLIQPDVGLGFGFEAGVEAAYRDEWTLSASAGGYMLGIDSGDDEGYAGFRLSTELRVGYRLVFAELEAVPFVVHLSAGAAIGYEERPELAIGEDGDNFFVSPTVRLSIRYFMLALTYAAYFDVDDPANTAHMINFGYAFEF